MYRRKLDIQEVKYYITTEDIASDSGGFKKPETNASTRFQSNYSQVEKIIFYTEAIKENIENKFRRISYEKNIINKIVDIFIKNTLVHELVHIQQFKNGKLTKKIIDEEKELDYKKRSLEIEAESIAKQVMSSYGEFEKEVMEYISSNKSFDNLAMDEIIQIYMKQFND